MSSKDYHVVRLSKSTALRVKSFNKGNSYEDNITAFLDYFERTGVNPWMLKEHPIEATMKGFDRVIAILKSIEKNKIDVINERLKDLDMLNFFKKFDEKVKGHFDELVERKLSPLGEKLRVGGQENDRELSEELKREEVTLEEVQELIRVSGEYKDKCEELQSRIDELEKEKAKLSLDAPDDIQGLTDAHEALKSKLNEVTRRMEKVVKPSTFGSGFQISQADYKTILDSLKNLTK